MSVGLGRGVGLSLLPCEVNAGIRQTKQIKSVVSDDTETAYGVTDSELKMVYGFIFPLSGAINGLIFARFQVDFRFTWVGNQI